MFGENNLMAPRYHKGEQVVIGSSKNQTFSPRDFELKTHAGQRGVVTDYYWISLGRGVRVFYIYTVKIENSDKEVVLHEDELEPYVD